MKTLASVWAYGIYCEVNPEPAANGEKHAIDMYGTDGRFIGHTNQPERPGPRFFAPYATWITASGRLLLGLLEYEMRRRDGWWMFMDTDSAFVIATKTGGLVPCRGGDRRLADGTEAIYALSWDELAEVVMLRDLDGLDYREIGDFLRLPDGTVKSRLNRARIELARSIRRRIGQSAGGQGSLFASASGGIT